MLTRPVVLYDGACGVCRAMVRWLARRDAAGRLVAVPASERHAVEGLPALSEAALAGAMHVVLPDGSVHAGGAAVREIVRRLPAGRPAATIMGWPVVRSLVELGYRLVAVNRHRIGCGAPACDAAARTS